MKKNLTAAVSSCRWQLRRLQERYQQLGMKSRILLGLLLPALGWWLFFSLPRPLFDTPYSLVLEDAKGELLSARIAEDGQWRFPPADSLPERLMLAITTFEDKRFYYHPGVDPLALVRAFRQNIRAGSVISGGSTLSMQVMRMAEGNRRRTLGQKAWEMLLALRLELAYSKASILQLWAAHAPFGGNVSGIEAAAWRYFGKPPARLSWAEAAMLAVLPNSPALIHPGRNRDQLFRKRNQLLERLWHAGKLDSLSCRLAQAEPLPEAPRALPRLLPHLLDRAWEEKGPGRLRLTIDPQLQQRAEQLVGRWQKQLATNAIHNVAALIVEVETGRTLAYVGNAPQLDATHSPWVDLIRAPRSPGSLLKPLLLGLALQEGRLLPESLLPDAPTSFGGFRPENFHRDYQGAVSARLALARSLNVPFVHLLQNYGIERFRHALRGWGFSHIRQPASHYGLSLILGGCEISLWEAVGWYASLGRMVNHYYPQQGMYAAQDWRMPHYLLAEDPTSEAAYWQQQPFRIGAGAGWMLLDIMTKVERPDTEGNWERFPGSQRIAWKTGTSYGFRDAWAVGLNTRYAVGVWAGNANGEGRPGLVGLNAAAPLLFELYKLLPQQGGDWFEAPHDAWREAMICPQSGYPAGPDCPALPQKIIYKSSLPRPCPWHERIHTDSSGQWRVTADCISPRQPQAQAWFVLPPLLEYYYERRHPEYKRMPPWHPDCENSSPDQQVMQWIYPSQSGRILLPLLPDGSPSATVFSVAHRQPEKRIFWQLDEQHLGYTVTFHNMELRPPPGRHRLVLTDEDGHRLEKIFIIAGE